VEWLKTVARDSLDPYLYRVLYSHHTITNADEYSSYIDRTLHSLYTKGDRAHLVLRVNTHNAVRLKDLSLLMDGIIDVVRECNLPKAVLEELENLEVKINVQSPGPIEYITSVGAVALIAAMIFVINRILVQGGKFNFSAGWSGIKFNFKTKGASTDPDQLLKAIEQSTDAKEKLKEIARAMQNLEVESPKKIASVKDEDQA
jgi:restriction system protein